MIIEEYQSHTNYIVPCVHDGKPGTNKTFISRPYNNCQVVFIIYYGHGFLTNTHYLHFDN